MAATSAIAAATLGVWVEEFAPPAAPDLRADGGGAPPPVALEGEVFGGTATGGEWSEFVRVEDAETVATFTEGALAGWPAVTRRAAGEGSAWYVATLPEPAALRRLVEHAVGEAEVELPVPITSGEQVEVVRRGELVFAINHGPDAAELQLDGTDVLTGSRAAGMTLPQHGVAIVKR